MTRSVLRRRCAGFVLASALFVAAYSGCGTGSGGDDRPDGGRNGGSSGSSTAGAGGSGHGGAGMGGSTATGGNTATGGKTATGGTTSTGGKTATGGSTATGGKTATGGTTSTGGTTGGGGSTGAGGSSGTAGTTGAGEYGFTYRSPGSHTESCTSDVLRQTLTINAPDQDWLCTFNVAAQKGYVYARTTANGAICIYANAFPTYKVELAQISIGGVVTNLANPQYDGGGNHHNDALRFDYQGSTYEYYHSSFSVAGRRCQDMDCINVYDVGGTTPKTEGCSSARTLPAVCVLIGEDGTHGPLTDTFKPCK